MPKNYKEAVIITDLHLRDDIHPKYLDAQLATLKRIVTSKKYDCVLILGDIFEHRTSKSIVLIKFYEFLKSIKTGRIIILRGNHDTVSKTNTTETILSMYDNVAEIVDDVSDISIFKTPCTFIPHFEDDQILAKAVSKTKNLVFGHFGIHGMVTNGGYVYESVLKPSDFNNRGILGHIHAHKIYENKVHIVGNQYTVNFGEANQEKYYYELKFYNNGEVDIFPKKVKFGIKHLNVNMENIHKIYKKFNIKDFFTLLRVNIDELDMFKEREIRNELNKKYHYDLLDLRFDNILDKNSSKFYTNKKLFSINEGILEDYIQQNESTFSKNELRKTLTEIYDFK